MTNDQIIQKTRDFVEETFSGEISGHDWWHMYRVWKLAQHIAAQEKDADLFIVELGALLHDIADWKFHDGDMEAGPRAACEWLTKLGVDGAVIEKIEDIVRNVSFKGAGVKQDMKSKEGQIVSDADKLDAIGAIGIARTFAYGGGLTIGRCTIPMLSPSNTLHSNHTKTRRTRPLIIFMKSYCC